MFIILHYSVWHVIYCHLVVWSANLWMEMSCKTEEDSIHFKYIYIYLWTYYQWINLLLCRFVENTTQLPPTPGVERKGERAVVREKMRMCKNEGKREQRRRESEV